MRQFGVPYRIKAIKKTSSGLVEKFTIKQIRIRIASCLLRKLFIFFVFQVTKRIVMFHIEVPLMANLIHSPVMPNEQKIGFHGIAHFFGIDSERSQFLEKIWFSFWDFTEYLKSYVKDAMIKSALVLLMSIKWTYLVLLVDS